MIPQVCVELLIFCPKYEQLINWLVDNIKVIQQQLKFCNQTTILSGRIAKHLLVTVIIRTKR